MTGWLFLIESTADGAVPLCTSIPASRLPHAIFGWGVMIVAMMPPLVLPSVRHVAFRSLRQRRDAAISEFLAGYLSVWSVIGVAVLAAGNELRSQPARPLVAVALYGAAIVWEFTPAKRRALWRCHRIAPLALDGWRAHFSCLNFGAATGLNCLASCWLLMALPILAPHSTLAMVCIQAVMLRERYQRGRYPKMAVPALLVATAFILTFQPGLF